MSLTLEERAICAMVGIRISSKNALEQLVSGTDDDRVVGEDACREAGFDIAAEVLRVVRGHDVEVHRHLESQIWVGA